MSLSLMESADRLLIKATSLMLRVERRVCRSRSDLSCHHILIACAIGGRILACFSMLSVERMTRPSWLRCCASGVTSTEPPFIMHQQCPDHARILVAQGDRRHILVSSAKQAAQPVGSMLDFVLGMPNDRTGAVDEQRAQ